MLNFKGWQKVSEDKQTTTLKHEKGHEMTLAHKKLPKIQQEALKRLKLAGGGDIDFSDTPAKVGASKLESKYVPEELLAEAKTTPYQGPESVDDQPQQSPQESLPGSGSLATTPVQTQVPQTTTGSNLMYKNGLLNAPQGVELEQQGMREQQGVTAAAEAEKAKILAQQQAYQADLAKNYTNNINEYKGHVDDFANFAKSNPINPKHYQESMGTGQKVGTAIGLLLSGAGSGVTGGPNLAYEFLNKQIDRDISGQKDRMEQQKTVLGAYHQLYGDTNDTYALTKATMNDIYSNKIAQVAAQLGTPQAKANADLAIAKLALEKNQLLQDASQNRAIETANKNRAEAQGTSGAPQAQPQKQTPEAKPESENYNPEKEEPNRLVGLSAEPTPRFGGAPGAQASVAKKGGGLKPDEYADTPILNPNAQKHLDSLRYTPKAKDEIDQIKGQYTKAQQADTLLSQLHGVHQQLYKDAAAGGDSAYFRRHDPTSHIPFVGHALSSALTQPATDTETNRRYDTNKTRITNDIINALKGTPVGVQEIRETVDANTPEHSDSPETVARKERNIRIFIKNSVEKSLLKDWGLSK